MLASSVESSCRTNRRLPCWRCNSCSCSAAEGARQVATTLTSGRCSSCRTYSRPIPRLLPCTRATRLAGCAPPAATAAATDLAAVVEYALAATRPRECNPLQTARIRLRAGNSGQQPVPAMDREVCECSSLLTAARARKRVDVVFFCLTGLCKSTMRPLAGLRQLSAEVPRVATLAFRN